jgi:uncharacterized membrane protein
MKTLKSIWKWLNGNKTIIGSGLLLLGNLSFVKANISPDILAITNWTGGVLAGGGLVHHAWKGYFSTKIGNQGQIVDDPLKEPKLKNSNVQK